MKPENRFGKYLNKLRVRRGITLTQLGEGLCDAGMISRFERGEREPDRLLQNRLLTRLGVTLENYEGFLYAKDYKRWKQRQDILQAILSKETKKVRALLKCYQHEYSMDNSLEYQFYLAMWAQLRKYEGATKEELKNIFFEALQLTVPIIEKCDFFEKVLSLEEINLFLEYLHYCEDESSLQYYEKLIIYIEKTQNTVLSKAKLYPKAIYYFYIEWTKLENRDASEINQMIALCDKAIEILRDAGRIFYWWELLNIQEKLLEVVIKNELDKQNETKQTYHKYKKWKEILEELHNEYGIPKAMYEFCYLYVGVENNCIGDVIRIRRKMLGMTMKELCLGICSERTVSRLERNETEPQIEIVGQLMRRLKISNEFFRTEIETDSHEVKEKFKELKYQIGQRDLKCIKQLLEELKEQVSLENVENRQTILRHEVISQYYEGKISKKEYVNGIRGALECTVPYCSAIVKGERYLTVEEISCLQNIFAATEENPIILCELCKENQYSESSLRTYEFLMVTASSIFGNKGEYNTSNNISHQIIKRALQNHRICVLGSELYNLLWNEEQIRQKEASSFQRALCKNSKLEKCICICDWYRDNYLATFFKKKLI